jgi:RHS repeat-associated protein
VRILLEAGIDTCNPDISCELAGPGFGANAPHTKVFGSIACYQFHFQYDASCPLVQENSQAKLDLDITQSFDLVFSSDRFVVACNWTDRFTGKPFSATTGLYYYYHRWYDPSIGRFISPDHKQGKLSNPQSLNLYIYVLDQPTLLLDPSGLDWWNPGTWNQQQQAQFWTAVIIVVAVVVIVATAGTATPIALAAAGAALNTGFYTAMAGDKATVAGVFGSAVSGAISGAVGGFGTGILASAALAATGSVLGDIGGRFTESELGGRSFQITPEDLATDAFTAGLTAGIGDKILPESSVNNIVGKKLLGRENIPTGSATKISTLVESIFNPSEHPRAFYQETRGLVTTTAATVQSFIDDLIRPPQ